VAPCQLEGTLRGQVGAVQVLVLAPRPHVALRALAVVEDLVGDLHGEAGGPVEAEVGGVGGRAGVRLERDVGAERWGGARAGRRARRARVYGRCQG